MKIKNEEQVFNLMDTNGRRNDVVNALQGYLSILSDLKEEWGKIPDSLSQYRFYKQAIELSPDVFSSHAPYDDLQNELNHNQEFKTAIDNNNIKWLQNNQVKYKTLIEKFDNGIEDRARHYTNNLVKLGFAMPNRKISAVGKLLLEKEEIIKEELEQIIPIDNINIVYLRQLLKLRVYDNQGKQFYSPFIFAIYLLLKKDRISETEFNEMVQGLSPYFDFTELDNFVNEYKEGDILHNITINIPQEIDVSLISESVFKTYFKNKKSSSAVMVYWSFYKLLYNFNNNRTIDNLTRLLEYYEKNKSQLNKAFGCGKSIFIIKGDERTNVEAFIEKNNQIFTSELNKYLYIQFKLSKQLDVIREYSDTTKRIFKATGIISFEKGYVEFAYKELCKCIFNAVAIKNNISGNSNDYQEYEIIDNNHFCSISSLSEILSYSPQNIEEIINSILQEFGDSNVDEIVQSIALKRKEEFEEVISNKYPLSKVKDLLGLFNSREHDAELKEYVSSDATIPTIYEFIVGIAWYYFSGKKIDLLKSFNLTLSADFEPLIHAGGGHGDIVIYEPDKVVMLEATLMNANNQKRGEWEPVLRHSVNLKIEEELSNTGRKVITFFIADEFDANTINIWKAVAAVPMQSTINKAIFTNNVVIMPLSSTELSILTDKSDEYDKIIDNIRNLFEVEVKDFNLNWRDEFIKEIIKIN